MTNWDEFNSDDLLQIRRKVNYKYERGLIWFLATSIPLFFVFPYIPSKRSGPLLETMSYWDAVLLIMIIWVIALLCTAVYNSIRVKNEYERIKQYLKVNTQEDVINRIQTQFLDLDNKRVYFKTIGNFIIDKNLLNDFEAGDKAQIRIELNSGAIMSIKKLPLD